MTSTPSNWATYEQVARKVISDLHRELGVDIVEGKQRLQGKSGAIWEVDAKATSGSSDGFFVIEVRRHTTSGQKQEHLAALAYRIQDLGGSGGIIVSPLPLQHGARLVAFHEKIVEMTLAADSTTENYMAQFLERTFYKATVKSGVVFEDYCSATVIRTDGTRIYDA
ncbi:hypothetical protein ABQF08_21960 [Xanthomonas campestris pv. campestris]|uniref:hypothetical protein n=1 Tax=Xanthomonas campestris TaxID=339 RepID=UPI00114CCBCB|nr:hypothetical protein [Xanthomonas campestris]MCC3256522.1 hypothetical protein [Xanthomonas campestris pv. armoraciae]MCF8792765.1 hypothetical protein [Xanthomonas campestris pv. campestris]MCF8874105.1 hypothetical protein [Xanthomonas campestris pv. campestris]MCF8874260.1 hypothetical protein [Xanthomonas campestris pv. campestris]MEA0659875.1 hypothetical protein [Xanthomonas campestris pv. campestris]